MRRFLLSLVLNCAVVAVHALPDYDPFDYPAGANLIGQVTPDGLVWVAAGPAGTQVTVEAGNINVFGLSASSGNSIKFSAVTGPSARLPVGFTITSGTLYYSFALKVRDLTGLSTSGGHLAGFNNSIGPQTTPPVAVGTRVLTRATTNGGFNIGLSKASGTASDYVWAANVFNTNESIFLVGSYTFGTNSTSDDISMLWINPDPVDFGASNPSSPATLTATSGPDVTANQIASLVFFQRTGGAQPAVSIADELRMGRLWPEVTSTNTFNLDCDYPVCPGQRGVVWCLDYTNKNYDIYLPPSYSPTNNPLPILYTFNPNGNGMVGNFGGVASQMQMIVVGIRESSNLVDWSDFIDAVYAIMRDIRKRVHFDPTAQFTAGYSGGGYESYEHSKILRPHIAGVFAMCGYSARYESTDRYLTNLLVARANATSDGTGVNDHFVSDANWLNQFGVVIRDWWFPGGHAIAPDPIKTEALNWLISQRIQPGPNDQSDAEAKAGVWRAAVASGQGAAVFRECFAALMSKPRTYEAHQAQLVIDELQADYSTFRQFALTNLWPGDFAADYFYYRAFGAGKIGDLHTYYSSLKAATGLYNTSGDRTNDFKDLMFRYGIPRPLAALEMVSGSPVLTYSKDAIGLIYALEQSTNLLGGTWTTVSVTEIDNGDGTYSFSIPTSTQPQRFFQLRVQIQ